jgi:hypothetical protein
MSAVAIGEAVTGGALRATHFFNGRLLTGEDLGREQRSHAARLARLGKALGEGIADGLGVSVARDSTAANPIVTVTGGLAVTRSGVVLELAEATDVALAGSGPRPGSEPGALFADCQPFQPSEYSTGAGVYLLSVGPQTTQEGLAPVSGLHNADALCNSAYAVEGVSFRRLRLALPLSELDDDEHLRNRAAYRMFATDEVAELWRNPFGPPLRRYGLLDQLRPTFLHDDEAPLALIGWQAGRGITFIDHWSVRRRITAPTGPDGFGPMVADRLLAEGEARFLQFQEHIDELLLTTPAPQTLAAADAFALLPAAGLLPVGTSGGAPGFHFVDFFAGFKLRGPVHLEGARALHVLRTSFLYPPIEVAGPRTTWLYVVRENAQAEAAGERTVRTYVLFANGHTPYAASAQYDLSHWNFANVAIRVP